METSLAAATNYVTSSYDCFIMWQPSGEVSAIPIYLMATSLPALDVEAYLFSFHLQLEKPAGEAFLRLATSTSSKTLFQFKPKKKTHKVSPIEVLAMKFGKQWGIKLENIESIIPYVTPPWWCPPKMCIQTNKQQAKNSLDQRLSQLLPGEYF